MYSARNVRLQPVAQPVPDADRPVLLTDATFAQRREKVLQAMQAQSFDALVIYDDVEHSGNFEYLTGFMTRFEEGLLVIHASGEAALIVGNENTRLATFSRIPAKVLHSPLFSLPNQPMDGDRPLEDVLREAGIMPGQHVGITGWKLFTSRDGKNRRRFDAPAFVVDAVQQAAGGGLVENAAELFIGPGGVRTTNNANEIAHYEYGSALASDGVLRAMNAIEPGKTELEIGSLLHSHGQRHSVVTICSAGPRYVGANLYPTDRKVELGTPVSLTCGYRGGLASRGAYAVQDVSQLPEAYRDYVDVLAKPYFSAVTAWLENIHPGMTGGEMHALIESVLPRSEYHWSLCPGHLTAEEEWLCSPIYEGSTEELKSGMLLQIDIIPSRSGYAGVGCENGIALADEALREKLQHDYPDMWQRMQKRRTFINDHLGIHLPECVLPLSSGVAYMRPYLLDRRCALTYVHEE